MTLEKSRAGLRGRLRRYRPKPRAVFWCLRVKHDASNDFASVQNKVVIGAPRLLEVAAGLFENSALSPDIERHRCGAAFMDALQRGSLVIAKY